MIDVDFWVCIEFFQTLKIAGLTINKYLDKGVTLEVRILGGEDALKTYQSVKVGSKNRLIFSVCTF